MHNLLTSAFPAQYSTKPKGQYQVEHRIVSASTVLFALSDHSDEMLVDRDEGIWCCQNSTGTDIHVINYEKYINQYRRGSISNSKRCDFVLYDASRSHFVVAELTHCKQDSLNRKVKDDTSLSKEEYAQLKYQDSIQTLCAVPAIRSFIEQYPHKSCVFACRLKEDQPQNDASRAMMDFQAAVEVVGTITHDVPLEINDMAFTYTRCIYPDSYLI